MTGTTPRQQPSLDRALPSGRDLAQDDRDALEMAQLVQDHATRAIERHLADVADRADDPRPGRHHPRREHEPSA